jgi:hypothetical protein
MYKHVHKGIKTRIDKGGEVKPEEVRVGKGNGEK